jgi:predicted molibdopterin-dependent oxidoreductase YjgC
MFRRLDPNDSPTVTISVNGEPVRVPAGETVAAAVLAAGLAYTRTTPVSGAPRAPFCLMGVCYECLLVIDGLPNRRACMEKVREGMQVETQAGTGGLPA